MIRASGFGAATITDHDFVSSEQVRLAMDACGEMPFIPGIELSLRHQDQVVHLLGYFIDPQDAQLQAHILEVQAVDMDVTARLIDYYQAQFGYDETLMSLTTDALHTFYSMQFVKSAAAKLFENDSAKSMAAFLSASDALGIRYSDFCPFPVRDAIGLIHAAGGIAVLAHPGGAQIKMMQTLGFLLHDEPLIKQYVDWELDGIETGTPVHTSKETAFYTALCQKYGLLSTAGSDCHGDDPYLGPAAMGSFSFGMDNQYESLCAAHLKAVH